MPKKHDPTSKLIVANWKLHPDRFSEAKKLVAKLDTVETRHTVVICPPYVYLPLLKTKFILGVQDIFWQDRGAFTGEISGPMVKQFKVKYAIVGHSERKKLGETDEQTNLKLIASIQSGITPILCVGHGTTAQQSAEDRMAIIQEQLQTYVVGVDLSKLIVAYEPVWEIGTGKAEKPDHAERIAMFIKIKFGISKVLYGGGINAYTAPGFINTEIDGFLIGGASLIANEFKQIIEL